ncbi:hypothetical protein NADE_004725 [Nannochloris sp. 'desiccata']|nr:hypothetical protein NADE_004725 [Chlorella desiccata (nom. nud.)]
MSVPMIPNNANDLVGLESTNPASKSADAQAQLPNEVITIADRRVRVAQAGLENATIYAYCRQWTYNNPNPMYSAQFEEGQALPRIQHLKEEEENAANTTSAPLEIYNVGNKELKDLETITKKQRQRWKALGNDMRNNAVGKRAPYLQRLQAAISK